MKRYIIRWNIYFEEINNEVKNIEEKIKTLNSFLKNLGHLIDLFEKNKIVLKKLDEINTIHIQILDSRITKKIENNPIVEIDEV